MLAFSSSHKGLAACNQLSEVEWLGQVIVGSSIEQLDENLLFVARSKDEHGRVSAPSTKSLQHLETGQLGKHQVEDHQIVGIGTREEEAFLSICGNVHCAQDVVAQ